MAQTMIASKFTAISDGQIENAAQKFRDALRKQRAELNSAAFQIALETPNLGMRFLQPLRDLTEMYIDAIVRRVAVNRNRTSRQMVEATGRTIYADDLSLVGMPCGKGEEVEVFFFKLGKETTREELKQALKLRDLVTDPYAQAAVNELEPTFADTYPNISQWDLGGRCFCQTFIRWGDSRSVNVRRSDNKLDAYWWACGVKK